VRRQLISDSEICRRYRDGEALFTIGKRAGLWTSELQLLLVRNGQDVRTPAQINALKGRKRHVGTLRLKDDA
jgi:hypothetical protein